MGSSFGKTLSKGLGGLGQGASGSLLGGKEAMKLGQGGFGGKLSQGLNNYQQVNSLLDPDQGFGGTQNGMSPELMAMLAESAARLRRR